MGHTSILIAFGIVNRLDATSGGGIVFSRGDFDLAVVGERSDSLDKSLSISPCAHDRGSVQILEGSCDNLG